MSQLRPNISGVGRVLNEFARDLCRSRGLNALCIPARTDDEGAAAWFAQQLQIS